MTAVSDLLSTEPVVAATGVGALADALEAQAIRISRTGFRPPPAGTEEALARVMRSVQQPNQDAVERLVDVRPQLVDVARAGDVIPWLEQGRALHAGPPISWDDCRGPLRGALIGAALYEGWADSPEEAERTAAHLELAPCHDHGAVGPMAGVVTRSMPMAVLADGDRRSYVTLNEGLGKVLRYGAFGPEVIERLRWMERVLGPILRVVLRNGPVDVHSIIAQALAMGDEGHNRNRAATSLFLRSVGAALMEATGSLDDRVSVFRFIDSNDHFMLNIVMGAAKLASDAAAGFPGSSLVTVMTRNGTEFGVRLSGTGEAWFTAPAPVVTAKYLGAFRAEDANPDIGDSAITETVGLGGFAMAASPAIVGFVGGTAAEAIRRTLAMYEICMTEHPLFRIPVLESRGTPTGIDATRVLRSGVAPQINTGVAGSVPGVGMVGAGLVEAPMRCFVAGVKALAAGTSG